MGYQGMCLGIGPHTYQDVVVRPLDHAGPRIGLGRHMNTAVRQVRSLAASRGGVDRMGQRPGMAREDTNRARGRAMRPRA
jgi:hypothetical protein